MRIERLNSNKIKVTLTTADLINLDIDVEQLAPNSKELHTFLFHIMETIREETGFNPYSGQVVVEATPSRDGICIIVSRMGTETTKISKESFRSVKSIKAKKKEQNRTEIFYFGNFNDMCSAITEADEKILEAGILYSLNSTYCFIVENGHRFDKDINIMSEFSPMKSNNHIQAEYIKEHGKLIAGHKELLSMAANLRKFT